MTVLRKLARGKECQVRLACCNHDNATTVLAHLRLSGLSGIGFKANDIFGAYACAACHAYVDTHKDAVTQLAFAHGIFRTQAHLLKAGHL